MIWLMHYGVYKLFLDSNKLEPLFELLGIYFVGIFVLFRIRNKIEINDFGIGKNTFAKSIMFSPPLLIIILSY